MILKAHRSIGFIFLIFLILTIVGCEKQAGRPAKPESLPSTFSHNLSVKNEASHEIHIFPAPGLIGEPLVLKPGESIVINFMVNRKALLDDSGNQAEDTWVAEINKDHKFIGMRENDGLLRIKTPGGELWEYRMSLGTCWFEGEPPAQDHEIIIGERKPDSAVPALIFCK